MKQLLTILLLLFSGHAFSAEIRIAVASNFSNTMHAIVDAFESQSRHHVKLLFGSTGKHYVQIKHGAPVDLFFAADSYRPDLLEEEDIAVEGSRFTYATGRLVLWSSDESLLEGKLPDLRKLPFNHFAIANPKLAPYGRAAKEVLTRHGYWGTIQGRMVRGENIGQAFRFVKSGNAELGFVALSQVKQPGKEIEGSYWLVPAMQHRTIDQQAVIIKDNEASREFVNFVKSEKAKAIIQSFGYETP